MKVIRVPMLKALSSMANSSWIEQNIAVRQPFIKEGQASLHVASGYSVLPFAEALYGTNVTMTDIDTDALKFAARLAGSRLRGFPGAHEVVSRVESKKLDVTKSFLPQIERGGFDHVVMTDLFKAWKFCNASRGEMTAYSQFAISSILAASRNDAFLTLTLDGIWHLRFSVLNALDHFSERGLVYTMIATNLPNADTVNDGMVIRISKSPEFNEFLASYFRGDW